MDGARTCSAAAMMRKDTYMAFAHSKNEHGQRHDLVAHVRAVGHLTAQFAEPFGAQMAGYWLGLWDDVALFLQPSKANANFPLPRIRFGRERPRGRTDPQRLRPTCS